MSLGASSAVPAAQAQRACTGNGAEVPQDQCNQDTLYVHTEGGNHTLQVGEDVMQGKKMAQSRSGGANSPQVRGGHGAEVSRRARRRKMLQGPGSVRSARCKLLAYARYVSASALWLSAQLTPTIRS